MPPLFFKYFVAAVAATLPVPAMAGPPVSLPTVPGISRVFSSDDSANLSRSGGLLNDWRFRESRGSAIALSYNSALRFASCVSRFNREASAAVLGHGLDDLSHRAKLGQLAADNRACVSEAGAIHPLLLRAAFAEVGLRSSRDLPDNPVLGVPAVVDGYPLARVSHCQAALAPDQVKLLFATRPGTSEEHHLADQLYRTLPQCGTGDGLGRVEATVARLSLLDAVVTPSSPQRR